VSGDDTARVAAAASDDGSPPGADGLGEHRPPTDRIERDRVLAAVQRRLLGKKTTTKIGRFEITERVGAGAMGAVYRGRDPQLGRDVAIKLLHQAVDGSAGQQSRIVLEAQALARVHHPNVVTVFDIGMQDERTFVAMELVEGATLTEWLDEEPRSWMEVVEVMAAAGRGLEAVHDEGLVHRDLKPDNILIDARGVPRIADFGLVKPASDEHGNLGYNPDDPSHDVALTATGALMGTPAYMAPEQLARGKADARSDQYAFGATFFEALYGRRPFEASTIGELVQMTAEGKAPSTPAGSEVPKGVAAVVERALRPSPDERFAGMTALLAELESAMPREGGHGVLWRVATIALAVVLLGGAYWATRRGATETAPAEPSAPVVSAPSPQEHAATVEIDPEDAEVLVDGEPGVLHGGRLTLEGEAGATFVVRVALGDEHVEETVVITQMGTAAPGRVALSSDPAGSASVQASPRPPPVAGRRPVPGRRPGPTAARSVAGTPAPPPSAQPPQPGITPLENW
jgi:hypothetical protein